MDRTGIVAATLLAAIVAAAAPGGAEMRWPSSPVLLNQGRRAQAPAFRPSHLPAPTGRWGSLAPHGPCDGGA